MKIDDLKTKSIIELNHEIESLLREQFNLRMQKGTGTKPRASSFKEVRRNIARAKTILQQKLREKKHE